MNKETDIKASESDQRTLLTYSVLTGLTPLIPLPIVDDLAKTYFRRRLIRSLAESHRLTLSRDVLDSLSRDRESGCLGGCFTQLLLYPLKKIFRKVFYFLEWKRAIDLASHTYHYGYLVDYTFREGLIASLTGQGKSMDEVSMAIDKVCLEAPIKPVERAVGASFRQSKAVLLSAVQIMEQSFKRIAGKPDEEKVATAVGAVEGQEKQEITGLIDRLQKMIGNIPESHFRDLRARLDAQLDPTQNRAKGAR